MKKILLLSVLLMSFLFSFACDICGCGVGNYYLGILPEYKKRFLGLRYQHKTMLTHLGVGGTYSYLTTTETHHITELWGAYNIGKKFRVVGFLPMNTIQRKGDNLLEKKSGFGDIAVQGHYNFFNRKKSVGNNLLVQSAWAGVGIKLPTGKYDNNSTDTQSGAQNSFQLGSGSTDISLHLMYDVRLGDVGINFNLGYRNNGENTAGYKFGNKFSSAITGYYKLIVKKQFQIALQSGIITEASNKDEKKNSGEVFATGGKLSLFSSTAEISHKKISAGLNFQTPVSQSLANGQTKAQNRVMLYLNFSL